ncbi:MAG: hypothetical protein HRU33_20005 [Rhodobacteraceae bacterium]|nr:hypothetical protein [Paracoccaceae bacterium]
MSGDIRLLGRFAEAFNLPKGADEGAVFEARASLTERAQMRSAQMAEFNPAAQQPDPARYVPNTLSVRRFHPLFAFNGGLPPMRERGGSIRWTSPPLELPSRSSW